MNSVAKRKVDDLNDENNPCDASTYEEYVQKDNEKLRIQMKDIKDQLERMRRQKERLEERLKNELELRLKEKRESETVVVNQKVELDKLKREKTIIENQLRSKDNELDKIKTALNANVVVDDIECDKCDFKTRSEVSLILHTINHKLSHPNQRRLILHPNMFSSRNPNSSYLYMCPICEGTALTRNEIYPHIYQNHTKEHAYKCNECDIFFTHIDYLKTHHRHEHERARDRSDRNKRNLTIDIPKETLITTIYKPCCNRGTQTVILSASGTEIGSNSSSYTNSGNSYTYSPQFVCDEMLKCTFPHCSFNTNNRQKLEFHISAHTNSKYKCPYCAYVGNILTDIYRHVKKSSKHDGKKVFQCPKCDFGIDCEKSFKEHLRLKHFDDDTPEKEIEAVVEDIFCNKPSTNNSNEETQK